MVMAMVELNVVVELRELCLPVAQLCQQLLLEGYKLAETLAHLQGTRAAAACRQLSVIQSAKGYM
jgi:hypothetical protein